MKERSYLGVLRCGRGVAITKLVGNENGLLIVTFFSCNCKTGKSEICLEHGKAYFIDTQVNVFAFFFVVIY